MYVNPSRELRAHGIATFGHSIFRRRGLRLFEEELQKSDEEIDVVRTHPLARIPSSLSPAPNSLLSRSVGDNFHQPTIPPPTTLLAGPRMPLHCDAPEA